MPNQFTAVYDERTRETSSAVQRICADFVATDDYTTGGDTCNPHADAGSSGTGLGLDTNAEILEVNVEDKAGVYRGVFKRNATRTSQKLQVFAQDGTEVSANTDLSGTTFRMNFLTTPSRLPS